MTKLILDLYTGHVLYFVYTNMTNKQIIMLQISYEIVFPFELFALLSFPELLFNVTESVICVGDFLTRSVSNIYQEFCHTTELKPFQFATELCR